MKEYEQGVGSDLEIMGVFFPDLMGHVVVYGQEFLPFPPTASANVDVQFPRTPKYSTLSVS